MITATLAAERCDFPQCYRAAPEMDINIGFDNPYRKNIGSQQEALQRL
jgi:hypothetical protein